MKRQIKPVHNLNPEEWKNITTPEIAYFLGYLWADGYAGEQQYSFEILEDDFMQIWPILQKLGFLHFSKRFRSNSKRAQCCVKGYDKKILGILKDFGFQEKSKFSPSKIISIIQPDFLIDFIKGYFDGDGTVCIDKNNCIRTMLYSSFDYEWTFLENFCLMYEIPFNIYRKFRKDAGKEHQSYSTFDIQGGKMSRLKFLSILYDHNPNICLKRKYNKYLDIVELIKNNIKVIGSPCPKDICNCGRLKTKSSKKCSFCFKGFRKIVEKSILENHYNQYKTSQSHLLNITYQTLKNWLKFYEII